MTWRELQLSHNILAEAKIMVVMAVKEASAGGTWWWSQLQDGVGGGYLQDSHGSDLNYKNVVVVAP